MFEKIQGKISENVKLNFWKKEIIRKHKNGTIRFKKKDFI